MTFSMEFVIWTASQSKIAYYEIKSLIKIIEIFLIPWNHFSLNLIGYENKHILSLIWAFNIHDKRTNILDPVVSITTEKCLIYIFVVLENVSPVAKYYSGMCINTGKLGLSRYIFVGLLRDCHCTRIVGQ